MPIDTSMYGNLQAPDFAGAIDRGMRLADLAKQRRESADLKEAYKAGVIQNPDGTTSVDRAKTLSALAGKGFAKEAMQFDRESAADQQAKIESRFKQANMIAQLTGGVKNQADWDRSLAEAEKIGLDVSQVPKQFDPQFIESINARALSTKERLAQSNQDRDFDLRERELFAKRTEAARKLAAEKMPSPEQSKVAGFAERVRSSESVMDQLSKDGFDGNDRRTWAQKHLFNEARPVELQKLDQAQRNFVNAVLRRESGAAISKEEFDSARQQYFPQPGDAAEVLEQKRMNRLDVLAALESEGAPALKRFRESRERLAREMPSQQTNKKPPEGSGFGIQKANAASPQIFKTKDIDWAD